MIEIDAITKEFRVYRSRLGILKEVFGHARSGRDYDTVCSLDGVSLKVPSGCVHGIIGMNGAGKSTLLKILTGVLDPSSGTIRTEGRIAALLELGTGFHGDLSGRENVRINAAIMGFSPAEIEKRLPEIEDFAELGAFFDRPVKIYSSGMYVRLAFAFAVSVSPEVLIIDEALSVGDAYFQQKCLAKIEAFKKSGITILFVSHDLGAVRRLCESVTLLNRGKVLFSGTPGQALDLYNALLAEHKNTELVERRTAEVSLSSSSGRYESGSKAIEVTRVSVINNSGLEIAAAVAGDTVRVCIEAKVHQSNLPRATCGILLKDRLGYDIFGTNSHCLGIDLGELQAGDSLRCYFDLNLALGAGDYTLTVALHSDKSHVNHSYHWIDRAYLLQILPSTDFDYVGVAKLAVKFHHESRHEV